MPEQTPRPADLIARWRKQALKTIEAVCGKPALDPVLEAAFKERSRAMAAIWDKCADELSAALAAGGPRVEESQKMSKKVNLAGMVSRRPSTDEISLHVPSNPLSRQQALRIATDILELCWIDQPDPARLLVEVAKQTRGNPSMILLDGQPYKPIPTALADAIEQVVSALPAEGRPAKEP